MSTSSIACSSENLTPCLFSFGSLFMNDVLAERDLVALAVLLVPREAEAVRGEAGDDVVQAVAVDVVGVHLRAAVAHRLRVEPPDRIAGE